MEGLRKLEKVCQILEQNRRDPARLIPILQAVQEEYRYLPEEILAFVATSLNLTAAHVYGVATFYSHFTLKPKGKYIIRVCDGTACHVKKSTALLEAVCQKLGLKAGSMTTADMMFTVETVSCLGACGLAPVLMVNDEVHGQMTPEKTVKVIDEIIKKEEVGNGKSKK
jgi:NADH-quinone oxidoreductase subunit E